MYSVSNTMEIGGKIAEDDQIYTMVGTALKGTCCDVFGQSTIPKSIFNGSVKYTVCRDITDFPSTPPSPSPSLSPTSNPSSFPSSKPSLSPSQSPTMMPTMIPSTSHPSSFPSSKPSLSPSLSPTMIPTMIPSKSHVPSLECQDNELQEFVFPWNPHSNCKSFFGSANTPKKNREPL
uniref:Uncharacterized protein n=1 Tax=Corethron hystrix TaxID=216773 RepID=A0A7S1BQM0_9STRA